VLLLYSTLWLVPLCSSCVRVTLPAAKARALLRCMLHARTFMHAFSVEQAVLHQCTVYCFSCDWFAPCCCCCCCCCCGGRCCCSAGLLSRHGLLVFSPWCTGRSAQRIQASDAVRTQVRSMAAAPLHFFFPSAQLRCCLNAACYGI
jgi:hypothetical protein